MKRFRLPEQFDEAVEAAAECLRRGEVILYPTDTIYGLGADALSEEAVQKVRNIKGRNERNMLLILVRDMLMMEQYAVVTELGKRLAEKFLPGPLALILEAKKEIPPIVSGEHPGTVGMRIPNNAFCLALSEKFGKPFVTTSANLAGQPTETNVDAVLKQLGDRAGDIAVVIDEGIKEVNVPSTIVDARGDLPKIFREGAIAKADILGVS
jgi:L-threonylcarbamoyladenylate synthase